MRISSSVLEPPTFVAGLDDIAVVSEPIEQRCGHFGVAKYVRPFAKGEIGRDDDRGSFIESADEVEEQLSTGLSKWQVPAIRRVAISGRRVDAVAPRF